MNLVNELMRSAPRSGTRYRLGLSEIGSSSRQAGLMRPVARSCTKIFQKSVFTKPSAGRNGGPGLLLAKTDALPVEGAGQIVEQLLDFDFSRNELLLQRISDDGLQRRAACVETERQKIDFAWLGQTGGAFGLQQQAV